MTDHNREWIRNGERDPERRLARDAKAAGLMRSEYLLKRIAGVHDQAVAQHWATYELEKAIYEIEQLANEVWGDLQ